MKDIDETNEYKEELTPKELQQVATKSATERNTSITNFIDFVRMEYETGELHDIMQNVRHISNKISTTKFHEISKSVEEIFRLCNYAMKTTDETLEEMKGTFEKLQKFIQLAHYSLLILIFIVIVASIAVGYYYGKLVGI